MPGTINTTLLNTLPFPAVPQCGKRRKDALDDSRTITFRHWRVLQAVYDYGGLTEAAVHLHVTPPTVSYSMQSLEALLGIKLYHVQNRKIVFTPAGVMLVQRSRNLLRDAIALEAGAVPAMQALSPFPMKVSHSDH